MAVAGVNCLRIMAISLNIFLALIGKVGHIHLSRMVHVVGEKEKESLFHPIYLSLSHVLDSIIFLRECCFSVAC